MEMYGTRLLVFLEETPQSNKYRQVLLTKEEFKKMSLSVGEPTGKEEGGNDVVEMQLSDDLYDLPDLTEHY